jgi:hypothetical protein
MRLLQLLEDWLTKNARSNDEANNDIQFLTTQLHTVRDELGAHHGLDSDNWKWLRSHFCDVSSRAEEVAKTNQIIHSLRYASMEVRHDRIVEAHRKTFEWIYSPERLSPDDPRSRIEYKS